MVSTRAARALGAVACLVAGASLLTLPGAGATAPEAGALEVVTVSPPRTASEQRAPAPEIRPRTEPEVVPPLRPERPGARDRGVPGLPEVAPPEVPPVPMPEARRQGLRPVPIPRLGPPLSPDGLVRLSRR